MAENNFNIYLGAAFVIVILLLIAIIFKVFIWIGLGLVLFGLFLLFYASQTNNDESGIWGIAFLIGGLVIIFIGFTAYDFLEDIGLIDFLKRIFGKN